MLKQTGLIVLLAAASSAHAGLQVTSGTNGGFTKLGEVKARNFGSSQFGNGNVAGFELSLDLEDPFLPAKRTQDFYRQGVYLASNEVTLAYDASAGSMTFSVGASRAFELTTTVASGTTINDLQLHVVGRTSGVTVRLEDVEVDGQSFGDFDAAGAWRTWSISGNDLSDGFRLTGRLVIAGVFNKSSTDELNKLLFKIGQTPEVVIPLPTTAGLAGLGLLALGARRRR